MANTKVKVKQGVLQGKLEKCPNGEYVSFKGIPFAKPPLGVLRFAAPEPPDQWEGIRDALEHADMCLQADMLTKTPMGSEDCLYLNVYTPCIDGSKNGKYSVMVYIHGGAFSSGSGDSTLHGPEYFMTQNVILVTLNYRVEALGFLSVDTEEVPGNAGLKDQVAAMQWVKENIGYFGGDSNNITLFGESAGSTSVTYHLLSPLSKNLFNKAIAQSGVCTAAWASDSDAVNRAFRVGKLLGKDTKNAKELIEFLRSVPASDLVGISVKSSSETEIKNHIDLTFLPVVEKVNIPGKTFIHLPANELLSRGQINDVPLILGYTDGEGILFLDGVLKLKEKINNDFKSYFAGLVRLNVPIDMSNKAKEFYFKNQPFHHDTSKDMVHLRSDALFVQSAHNFAIKYSAKASSPVFFYVFSCRSELNVLENIFNGSHLKLTCHGEDIFYLFSSFLTGNDIDFTSKSGKMVEKMVALWTNMAKWSNPTPQLNSTLSTKWNPMKSDEFNYLHITDELKMKVNPDQQRIHFMNNLFRKYGFSSKL